MEIIPYIKWTAPGEKDKFVSLVKRIEDENLLVQEIMKEFGCDSLTARRSINIFRDRNIK